MTRGDTVLLTLVAVVGAIVLCVFGSEVANSEVCRHGFDRAHTQADSLTLARLTGCKPEAR